MRIDSLENSPEDHRKELPEAAALLTRRATPQTLRGMWPVMLVPGPVGPDSGLEDVILAMPEILDRLPLALCVIIGSGEKMGAWAASYRGRCRC